MAKFAGLSNSVEILQFQRGDERLVINMTIPQDEICEGPQSLTAQISLYSGVHPMTMSQSTAQVFTDDCAEQECGKKEEESYTQFYLPLFLRSHYACSSRMYFIIPFSNQQSYS